MVLSSLETIWFLENPWPWSKDMEKGLKWSENTLQACLKWITKSPFDSFLLKHMFKNCNFKIFENSVFFFKSMVIVNLVNFLSCKLFEVYRKSYQGYKIPIVMRATDSWTQLRLSIPPFCRDRVKSRTTRTSPSCGGMPWFIYYFSLTQTV